MPIHSRAVLGTFFGLAVVMVAILGLHVGDTAFLKVGDFSPLVGAFCGGILVLISVNIPMGAKERIEPWLKREQLAWNLIGCGCLAWGLGECFWRYYLAQGQSPFPSLADLGYSFLPPLCFLGLMLQPFGKSNQRQVFLALDSLISMGALLSIAWFLLLGSLSQVADETSLAKFLGLYYPTADIALLSCIIFLLLGGPNRFYQARARRIGLLLVGIGLGVFAVSDFLFNLQQNLGTFVEESWADLGWPLGIMTIGLAAYFRRFIPPLPNLAKEEQIEQETQQLRLGSQILPYILVALLFFVLVLNVLSADPNQVSIRPVLLIATIAVTSLVVIRQIITMFENERLVEKQSTTLQQLETVYQDIEKRQSELEEGVVHLKGVQTRLANGDVEARVQRVTNDLWPLAAGLNLMADRMMRAEHIQKNSQKLAKAVYELDQALKRKQDGGPFVLPLSCIEIPEMHSLVWTLGLGSSGAAPRPAAYSGLTQSEMPQLAPSTESSSSVIRDKPPVSSIRRKNDPGARNPRNPLQHP